MSRFDKALTNVENTLAAATLGLAALLAIVGVIIRYLFGEVIFWSEEAIIYLIICSTFFGAVITLRHGEHVNVDLLPAILKERGKRFFALLAALVLLAYLVAVGFFAWLLIFGPVASNTVTPSLKLPLWVVEISVPIGFTLMALRTLQVIYRIARKREPYPDKAGLFPAEASTMDPKTSEDGQ